MPVPARWYKARTAELYGGTSSGGGSSNCFGGCGTLFQACRVGLKSFIESVPNFGKVEMVIRDFRETG